MKCRELNSATRDIALMFRVLLGASVWIDVNLELKSKA
jgi:hypothetical protein